MIVNSETLKASQIGFRTEFNKAFDLATPGHELFTMIVPSNKATEQYKWLGSLPLMKEWLDDATFEKLSAFGWEIKNRDWQAGIEVDRNDIEDDSLGLLVPSIQMMGEEAKRHPGQLVFDLLNAGFTGLCYDGQFFFDTDHKDGNGPTQANKITTALSVASWRTARKTMRKIVDMKGRPMNIAPTHLMVPPDLEGTAKDILQAERLASGASNTEYKAAELVVNPYLTSATAWFAFDLSKRIRPFVHQTRRAPEFVAQDNPDDERVVNQRKFRYSTFARYNAGYGLWQFAFGSDGTT
jgi:phage major head subunit gpT-like protein